MVAHVLAKQWSAWEPTVRYWGGSLLMQRTIVVAHQIFSQQFPIFERIPSQVVEGVAALAVFALVDKNTTLSYPVLASLAAVCIIQYYFFNKTPSKPLPDFVKEITPDGGLTKPEVLDEYLKPLENVKGGRHYIFAQTGLSLPCFAQCFFKKFPGKKLYLVERSPRKGELETFVKDHPGSLIISNVPEIFDQITEIPTETICCEIFSDEDKTYEETRKYIHLRPLTEDMCLGYLGIPEDKRQMASEVFKLVQKLEQEQETAGLVTIDTIMPRLKDKEENILIRVFEMLREQGLRSVRLIPMSKVLGLPYMPRKVTKPSCLKVEYQQRAEVNDEARQIGSALGKARTPHVIVGGKSEKELEDLIPYLNKPDWRVVEWDISYLFNPSSVQQKEPELNLNALGHFLDYLYNNPKTVLFVPVLTHSPLPFLKLIPPETYILVCYTLSQSEGLGELNGWFQYLGERKHDKK